MDWIERGLIRFDRILRPLVQLFSPPSSLNQQSAALMRVNHAGEIAAQALYHGHACTVRSFSIKEKLLKAAEEENEHLMMCLHRLETLGAYPSRLSVGWYMGSFLIGVGVGLMGDRWTLSFVAETERQVVQHLEEHIRRLPDTDQESRSILERMKEDEGRHATSALEAGGYALPKRVQLLMRGMAKVMTTLAYRI